MGAKHDKPLIIDPSNINSRNSNGNSPEIDNAITTSFRRATINGKITKDRFNEALICLEKYGQGRLRDTPLGYRLLNLFDTNGNNEIDDVAFNECLSQVLTNPEKRFEFSFKVFDKDKDNQIKRREFQEYFEETWMAAFRLLGDKIQRGQNPHQVTMVKIEKWAQTQLPQLHQFVDNIYLSIDRQGYGFIDYMSFKEWLKTTDIKSIKATFDNETIEIPLSLVTFNL